MAGESYYFLFSVVAVLITILHIFNVLYFKAKGKSILGEDIIQGAPGCGKFKKLSSNRAIIVAATILLVFIANLVYDVGRLLDLDNQEYARGMLTFGPAAVILFFIVMLLVMRNRLKSGGR